MNGKRVAKVRLFPTVPIERKMTTRPSNRNRSRGNPTWVTRLSPKKTAA